MTRKCHKCQREVRYTFPIFDSEADEAGLIAYTENWCLGCIYREGNHEHYKQNPPKVFTLDSNVKVVDGSNMVFKGKVS